MEKLRRFVRDRIGYRSSLYQIAARVLTDLAILWREGFQTYRNVNRFRRQKVGGAIPIWFRSLEHPIYLRPDTADLKAALNNIVRREYGHQVPVNPPEVLIDAGGYIGDTSVYFLNRFPGLRAYVLEPNVDSLEMARLNLKAYGERVTIIPAALSANVGTVSFGGKETGARIEDEGEKEVVTTNLQSLLQRIPERRIDILKMDIEGAEYEIFSTDVSQWLHHVQLLIVETHGAEIEAKLLEVMAANHWRAEKFRNLYYCSAQVGTA